jgi:endonuclease YncB( thermonuclease family)
MELQNCTYENTKKFNFNNRCIKAKCVKVYDGDTITAAFDLGGVFYTFSIRMNGYDSPEIRTKDENEKKFAILSRDYLKSIILDKIITLKCKSNDKYGRILADVEYEGIDINKKMLENGYSIKYDGGTKQVRDYANYKVNK